MLAGLPTQEYQPDFGPVTLQIYCFSKAPWKRYSRRGYQNRGIQLPEARLMRVNMDNQEDAEAEFQPAFQAIINSVLEGEWVLVHCMAGVHRAAALAVAIRAALHSESVTTAIDAITAVRAIEFTRALVQFNRTRWNDGNFMAWLEDYAKLAKHLWQKSLKNRGITRIGQTEEGFIHLVKKRPNQSQDQSEVPECEHQYGGEPKNLIAVTQATGANAVTEAASWTLVTDSHVLCAVCAKLMSTGILSALQNHNIE